MPRIVSSIYLLSTNLKIKHPRHSIPILPVTVSHDTESYTVPIYTLQVLTLSVKRSFRLWSSLRFRRRIYPLPIYPSFFDLERTLGKRFEGI